MVDGDLKWEDYTYGKGDYTLGLKTIQSPFSWSWNNRSLLEKHALYRYLQLSRGKMVPLDRPPTLALLAISPCYLSRSLSHKRTFTLTSHTAPLILSLSLTRIHTLSLWSWRWGWEVSAIPSLRQFRCLSVSPRICNEYMAKKSLCFFGHLRFTYQGRRALGLEGVLSPRNEPSLSYILMYLFPLGATHGPGIPFPLLGHRQSCITMPDSYRP